ncbi:class I SAM-dependent methyltransferase [Coraliomargarita algicola]|uniref:Class I SAM-dependent methyltransferase n=1 Tax=Coraliomargarita algicola TaxID=3092156 RepID=A0ABZ0RDE2_9BACT|nr:class I SAM-dependent methyltransferase [Coraliomargarita sp. J2-16]WPJ93962.1 class I SAM-dependent methyltransferase [Coraliomargarita sp. J2-16]
MQLTQKVHQRLTAHLKAGDLAIDATAGNGYDTLYLAQTVSENGHVIAIDIQEAALQSTQAKLTHAKLNDRVELHCTDHATYLQELCNSHTAKVSSILFNLGYLPGSDKSVQTLPSSTEKALQASLQLLQPNGLLCVTAYRGHPGGIEESQVVENWMRAQKKLGHSIECHTPPSPNSPPILWLLSKSEQPHD